MFACLVGLCAAVALVYALTSSEDPDRVAKDTVWGFVLMFGGICLLGGILMAIPLVFLG
mgnify:CR=1 FL=1